MESCCSRGNRGIGQREICPSLPGSLWLLRPGGELLLSVSMHSRSRGTSVEQRGAGPNHIRNPNLNTRLTSGV